MRHMKVVLAVMLMLTTATAFSKKSSDKEKEKIVYAFGVSASFVDTVVYYTGIHVIDSVSLDKEGFLPTRELYSYQLKEFVEKEYAQNSSTCMIYFADKKKKIDKEYSKLIAKYKKNKEITLKEIPADKFKFKKPELGEE